MQTPDPRNTENKNRAGGQPGGDSSNLGQTKSTGTQSSNNEEQQPFFQPPSVNLPKGGGAIQGIGEKFQANPVTGTGSMSVPIAMSPGRGGFSPQLSPRYDSGAGNSPFGLGWNIGLASISRKTSKGLPQYDGLPKYYDALDSDVFILSGAEELVPVIDENGDRYIDQESTADFIIYCYRTRIEGLFARIEKWVHKTSGDMHWKSITKENITTLYGERSSAKISDPADSRKVFQWRIEKSYDDKGNVLCFEYKNVFQRSHQMLPEYESGYFLNSFVNFSNPDL